MSRVFTCGFEFSSLADNGIASVGSGTSINSIHPHRSAGANGGIRALDVSSVSASLTQFQNFAYIQKETFIRMYFRLGVLPSTKQYIFYNLTTSAEIFRLRFQTSSGPFILSVGGSDVATGSTTFLADTYYCMKIYAKIDISGQIILKLDGVEDINYSGATNVAGPGWNQIRLNNNGRVFYDDFAVNDTYTRVNYKNGNGQTPLTTINSDSPGSATIINHIGDGVSGYLIIDKISGDFIDSNTLTDVGSFSAEQSGEEDTVSTSEIKEGFVQLFYPNNNGEYSELTNSLGNQVNNFSYVNEIDNLSTFVSDETGNKKDTYQMQDLPSEALSINHVDSCFLVQRDGSTVNNIRSVLRIGAVDNESYMQVAPGTMRWVKFSYQKNPETDDEWVSSDISNLESGPKLEP